MGIEGNPNRGIDAPLSGDGNPVETTGTGHERRTAEAFIADIQKITEPPPDLRGKITRVFEKYRPELKGNRPGVPRRLDVRMLQSETPQNPQEK